MSTVSNGSPLLTRRITGQQLYANVLSEVLAQGPLVQQLGHSRLQRRA